MPLLLSKMINRLFRGKKFKESPVTEVYSTTYVIDEGSPILLVSHELDGAWQFMSGHPINDYSKIARVVKLQQVIKLDKTVLKVADLPLGYAASRNSPHENWVIAKIQYSEQDMKEFGFYCSYCGLYHKNIPMAYGADAPYQYYLIPEEERTRRCELNDDQCIIDEQLYFVRGQIILEVDDNPDHFFWNVWVSVSKEYFDRMSDLWEDENRILEPPYQSSIATQLDIYPSTLDLPAAVITRDVGIVPKVVLADCDHPLYLEQENGINMKRVGEFASKLLYNH